MQTRKITEDRDRLFNNALHIIRKVWGHTVFGGCICTKACKCEHNFVSKKFNEYRLTKKWGIKMTSVHLEKKLAYKEMRNLSKEHKKWKNDKNTKGNN